MKNMRPAYVHGGISWKPRSTSSTIRSRPFRRNVFITIFDTRTKVLMGAGIIVLPIGLCGVVPTVVRHGVHHRIERK
jgi:hypothetical protein